MASSTRLARKMRTALGGKKYSDELEAELGANPVAAYVAPLGATSNLSALAVTATSIAASNFTAAVAAEPTKAEVDFGINTLKTAVVTALDLKADNADCELLRTQTEARLDAIEAKVDAVIASLIAALAMAAS